jgi:Tfp pilus assembly protein PilF
MRMNTYRALAAWLPALVLGAAALSSAATEGRLIGKVVGPDGKPVAGVTVTTTCKETPGFKQVATTNDKGIFLVDFPKIEMTYVYQLEKAGFVTQKIEQFWTALGTDRHEFKMLPGQQAEEGAPVAPPASGSSEAVQAYNAGVAALKARDFTAARAKLEEALRFDPALRPGWVALGGLHLDQKRYKEAAEAGEKALALGVRDEATLRLVWEAYRNLGDEAKATKARQDLQQFGQMAEEAKRIHNEGVSLSKAGDDAAAFGRFKEALALDPGFQPALLGLATSALKIDKPAEAAAAAETMLKADPQNAQALRIRYNAALKLADRTMIIDALGGLAAIEPATARESLYKLGSAAYDADDSANAKVALVKLLELDPAHPKAHYLLGLILVREGAMAAAKTHLRRFIELAPGDPDAAAAKDALQYLK